MDPKAIANLILHDLWRSGLLAYDKKAILYYFILEQQCRTSGHKTPVYKHFQAIEGKKKAGWGRPMIRLNYENVRSIIQQSLLKVSVIQMSSLAKKSNILKLKSRFFFIRILTYFSFLLIPVWMTKLLDLNPVIQVGVVSLYILFMCSQWFLLGKEIDHRLKIYFSANSSMDRVIYRMILGKMSIFLYFLALSFLPADVLKHFFWGTWVVLGLFYSWPTRGKIIKETVSTQFGEFKFLDSFERTVLVLIFVLFVISIPEVPKLDYSESALKLLFDTEETISPLFWKFMSVNYFPFLKYPTMLKISYWLHFYFVGIGLFLLAFHALLRYFFSRRLSLLGIFAVVSTWSFSKILANDFHWSMTSTYSVIWIWSILWCTKSSTYRSGLFLGHLALYGTLIEPTYIFLLPIQVALLYFCFLREETFWFKRQLLKYMLFSIIVSLYAFFLHDRPLNSVQGVVITEYIDLIRRFLDRKAFFVVSVVGALVIAAKVLLHVFKKEINVFSEWRLNSIKLFELLISLMSIFIFGLFLNHKIIEGFHLIWLLCFLSLIPLEWIFQSISKFRSKRNLIYATYILICLLDSHIEGRIKILLKLLE